MVVHLHIFDTAVIGKYGHSKTNQSDTRLWHRYLKNIIFLNYQAV